MLEAACATAAFATLIWLNLRNARRDLIVVGASTCPAQPRSLQRSEESAGDTRAPEITRGE
jgi:hypothetical protein